MASVASEIGAADTLVAAQAVRPPGAVARVAACLAIALLLTLWQVALTVALSGRPTLEQGYRALVQWDAGLYAAVASKGYGSPDEQAHPEIASSAAWFPAFPLAARYLSRTLGIDAYVGGLIVSQLSCWLFWTYLLLLLRRWRIDAARQALALAFLLAQPGIFFLVVGYTESLFLAGLVGMIYWLDGERPARAWAGALHGFVMAATRFVGGPLAIYPLLRWSCGEGTGQAPARDPGPSRLLRLAVCSAVIAAAPLSYFAFCRARFGHWDQYFISERQFWDVKPDYLFFLNWRAYVPRPLFHFHFGPDWLSQCYVVPLMAAFAWLARREWLLSRSRLTSGWQERIALGALAGVLFYLSVAAKVNLYMNGMLRFALPILVLMVLVFLHQGRAFRRAGEDAPNHPRRWAWIGSIYFVGSFGLQLYYIYRFTHAMWVA